MKTLKNAFREWSFQRLAQPSLYTQSLFGVDTMLGRERESE